MAQANSNAQREPSMEEILASIRRIIEDSDAAGASNLSAEETLNDSGEKPAETAVVDGAGQNDVDDGAETPAVAKATTENGKENSAGDAVKDQTASDAVSTENNAETTAGEPESAHGAATAKEAKESTAEPREETTDEIAEQDTAKSSDAKPDDSFKSLLESAEAKLNERDVGESTVDKAVSAFRKELAVEDEKDKSPEIEADNKMSALNLSDIGDDVARQSDSDDDTQPEEDKSVAVTTDKLAANVAVLSQTPSDNSAVTPDPAATSNIAEPQKRPDLGDDRLAALAKSIASGEDLDKAADKPQNKDITRLQPAGIAHQASAAAAVTPPRPLPLKRDLPAMPEAETKKPTPLPVSNDTPAVTTAAANKAPIISEQAGRQVAAAFDELSEAFSQTRKKSFDEMAEEMMRPMLQDWLDNNLPVLVERLVREEIDRSPVAPAANDVHQTMVVTAFSG